HLNGTRTVAILKSNDITLKATLTPDIEETSKLISEVQKEMKAMAQGPEEKALLEDVSAKRERYLTARDQVFKLKGDNAESSVARETDEIVIPAMNSYIECQIKLSTLERGKINELGAYLEQSAFRSRIMLFGLLLIGLISSVLA